MLKEKNLQVWFQKNKWKGMLKCIKSSICSSHLSNVKSRKGPERGNKTDQSKQTTVQQGPNNVTKRIPKLFSSSWCPQVFMQRSVPCVTLLITYIQTHSCALRNPPISNYQTGTTHTQGMLGSIIKPVWFYFQATGWPKQGRAKDRKQAKRTNPSFYLAQGCSLWTSYTLCLLAAVH